MSLALRRHSVIRLLMSVMPVVLSLSVVLAPVLLVELLVAPIVLELLGSEVAELLGDVLLALGVVLVVELMSVLGLGDVLLVTSGEAARKGSVDVSGEVVAVLDGSKDGVVLVFEVGLVELVVSYGEVVDGVVVEARADAE